MEALRHRTLSSDELMEPESAVGSVRVERSGTDNTEGFSIRLIDRATVIRMELVTISPKYQVVIPQKIREALGLRSGEKAQDFAYRNRIEIIPVKDIKQLRGLIKGVNTGVTREADRV
jgi:AbrB family looped-hinge helix DNA binding protein